MEESKALFRFLNDFSTACENIEASSNDISSDELMEFLNVLFVPLDELNKERERQAYHYNIFEILKIQSLEALVHSPFLCNLLNVYESHACGDLFLKSFIKYSNVINDFDSSSKLRLIEIKNELNLSEFGIADLFLIIEVNSKRIGIVIENKINAGDQDCQLWRYYEFLNKNRGHFFLDELKLIYLTKRKSPPSQKSISSKEGLQYSIDELNIKLMGYKQDIMPWLVNCLQYEVPERVKQTIVQYINTLEKL